LKSILIAGAGGLGREVLQIIKDINSISPHWHIKGFLDDGIKSLKGLAGDIDIIGRIDDWIVKENEVFVCAIFDPFGRRMVVEKLKNKGAQFVNIIHPKAAILDFSIIGEGVIMYRSSALSVNSKIGDFTIILDSGIGHDALIGNYTSIASCCAIGGNVTIGDNVLVGSGAVVMPNKKIGDNSSIGTGSVVVRNVKSNTSVFGNPAKKMQFA